MFDTSYDILIVGKKLPILNKTKQILKSSVRVSINSVDAIKPQEKIPHNLKGKNYDLIAFDKYATRKPEILSKLQKTNINAYFLFIFYGEKLSAKLFDQLLSDITAFLDVFASIYIRGELTADELANMILGTLSQKLKRLKVTQKTKEEITSLKEEIPQFKERFEKLEEQMEELNEIKPVVTQIPDNPEEFWGTRLFQQFGKRYQILKDVPPVIFHNKMSP